MSKIVSRLTIRLTEAEAAQLELVKHLLKTNTASEAIKYLIEHYPRFTTHYRKQAEQWKEKELKYEKQARELDDIKNALGLLARIVGNDSKD